MELRILKQTQQDRDEELAAFAGKSIEDIQKYKIKDLKTISILLDKKKVQNENGSINADKLSNLYKTCENLQFHGYLRTLMYTSIYARPKSLFTLLKKSEGKKILDFGAGVGTHTIFAIENGAKVDALDVWGHITDFANWRLKFRNLPECVNLAHNYILPREQYDICICVEVLEHITNPAKRFQNITNSLRKGAYLSLRVSRMIKDTSGHLSENIQNWQKEGIPILKKFFKPVGSELYRKV